MTASSVTGVSGPGMSNGLYKPKNSCSCSCCCGDATPVVPTTVKKGCYKNYKTCKVGPMHRINSGNSSIKIC